MPPETIWDISPLISAAIPVWPGDTPFDAAPTWEIKDGCPVRVSRMTMTTHLGAHTDAPSHYDSAGKTIDQVGLQTYIGPCRVIHCIGARRVEAAAPRAAARVERRPLAGEEEHDPAGGPAQTEKRAGRRVKADQCPRARQSTGC